MSTISLRLPNSLHKTAKRLAEKDGISMNQLITSALAEKIAAFATKEYLEERAKRGSRNKFRKAMANVPNIKPEEYDRL